MQTVLYLMLKHITEMGLLLCFFCCIYFGVIGAAKNSKIEQQKCYQSVNTSYNELTRLTDLFNSSSSSVNVSKVYDLNNLEKSINELQTIEEETRKLKMKQNNVFTKLNETEQNIAEDQNLVDELLQELLSFSNYNTSLNELLNEAKKYKHEIEDSVRIGKNVSKVCQQGQNKYKEFESILNGLVKSQTDVGKIYGEEINRAKTVNERVDIILKETENVKKYFDEIKLPVNLVKNYINDSEESLKRIIEYLRNNTIILKELLQGSSKKFNRQLINNGEAVAKTISEIENNVSQMNAELNEYENTFTKTGFQPTVDEQSDKLLRNINDELANLEKTFGDIDFTEDEKKTILKDDTRKYLADIREKKLLLKEYTQILDVMPSDEEIKNTKKEIKDLEVAIESTEKLHKLESELVGLIDISEQIRNTSCNVTSGLPT